jgi:hypothetical protein
LIKNYNKNNNNNNNNNICLRGERYFFKEKWLKSSASVMKNGSSLLKLSLKIIRTLTPREQKTRH